MTINQSHESHNIFILRICWHCLTACTQYTVTNFPCRKHVFTHKNQYNFLKHPFLVIKLWLFFSYNIEFFFAQITVGGRVLDFFTCYTQCIFIMWGFMCQDASETPVFRPSSSITPLGSANRCKLVTCHPQKSSITLRNRFLKLEGMKANILGIQTDSPPEWAHWPGVYKHEHQCGLALK